MTSVIRKLERFRAARERAARERAQSLVEIEADDDDDDERERAWRALQAWEALENLRVDVSKCDLAKPIPVDSSGHVRWPIVCEVADATDQALVALLQHDDIKKILRAGRNAMRTLRVSRASVTHADRTEYHGKSVVGYIVGCKGDGTPAKCVAFQKTLNRLYELGGNYAGSTTLSCGIAGTLGMQHCFVLPMAIVKPEDRCLGEGSLFGAMVYATGYHLVGQCTMSGAPDVWAPDVLEYVLADEDHPLHEYAKKGIAPPLMAGKSREEMSGLIKEGLANMSDDSKKRCAAARQKSGVGLPGEAHRSKSTEVDVLAKQRGFTYFILIAELHECLRDNRAPASWAAGILNRTRLGRVKRAGLEDGYFVTDLPEEKEKGLQRFYVEGYVITKERGHCATHVHDYQIATQRGCFDAHSVAVALRLFGENERPPALPFYPRQAPVAVKELIERALAWSPPASEPSPPPAKKPRSAAKKSGPPRRSARLKK